MFVFNFIATFSRPHTSSEIVRLNVGGHLYTTMKSTLKRYQSLALQYILDYSDREGNVVVDRDGRMFEYILGFLRTDKLCLPDDFSDFDSLTTEVDFFDIPNLSSCLKKAKDERLLVRYIEILETKVGGSRVTVLKGRKEDLKTLPLTTFQIVTNFETENAKDSSYVEIILRDRNARLQLTEVLGRNKWTCESADFSTTTSYSPGNPHSRTIEHWYRDRWKK